MRGPTLDLRPGGWLWATSRLLAFGALFVTFGIVLGVLWAVLPIPDTGAAAFLATAVTAAAAFAAGAVLIRGVDGRPVTALGLGLSRQAGVQTALGAAIGAGALAAAVLALLGTGALHYVAQPGTAGAWAAIVLGHAAVFTVAAFAEEALFRGYPFQVLARAGGPVVAVMVTSVLFAIAHGANPDVGPIALANIFLAGVMLGVAYLRTLSLWFVTAVHVGWNWAMATLFDLPVSGIAGFDTPLYEPVVGGPAWWSGGAFGPEGGLVGTLAFGLALFALLRLRGVRPDSRIEAAGPLMIELERDQE
ncbi:hypothetical protein BH23GEM10_BH23GEM10_05000 [soil metagenome]